MEYIWYFIAALGAGVGTGLAGLSAATVMVPILIVLCPSFYGETGAYHATAIALASDILGSAFTAGIYIKHKNIDLKRGFVMLVCIISMCVAGSFAAFAVGNVVLGSFSLFLCVGIGIRFLIKPDTGKDKTVSKGAKLDWKGVLISLFFGLTIGFGTGFVGSGGGMMMLVVFTAFLGMERKSAVGTSTFIMTFTALIAFASHAMIDTDILLKRWDVLLICIVTATVASIVSAQFANKVNNKVVGIVTGWILLVLGVTMLTLNYWAKLSASPLFFQTWSCFWRYIVYIAAVAVILLILRFTCRIPKEIFRKMLHLAAFSSPIVITFMAENWKAAVLTLIIFSAILYPILKALEKWPRFSDILVERRKGEIKNSLLLLFLSQALLIGICWGVFDKPYIAVTATVIWGFGDGAAALVGKKFGKHQISLPFADNKKTWEGSGAMMCVSLVVGSISMLLLTNLTWYHCLLTALVAAPFSAFTELCTHKGYDTVTVPFALMVVLYLCSLAI